MTTPDGNAADWFVDRPARDDPSGVAFEDPWRSLTRADLATAAQRFAGAPPPNAIARERRIVMLMLDTVDFPVVFWGALRAGVVPVPINTLLPADITGYILQDSRAAALFISAPLLEALKPAARRVGRIIVSHPDARASEFVKF